MLGMGLIVGAVEREGSERLELALDQVEPARVGRQEDELDAMEGLRFYNEGRAHTGRLTQGRSPLTVLVDNVRGNHN